MENAARMHGTDSRTAPPTTTRHCRSGVGAARRIRRTVNGASKAGALDQHATTEGLKHLLRDRTRLGIADLATIELHHGNDLGGGAGEETFVGVPDIVAGEINFLQLDAQLRSDVD